MLFALTCLFQYARHMGLYIPVVINTVNETAIAETYTTMKTCGTREKTAEPVAFVFSSNTLKDPSSGCGSAKKKYS